MYWISSINYYKEPTRKERKRQKSTSIESMWKSFLGWVSLGLGCPNVGLYSNTRGLLAYSFEREGWPNEGDEFDRMRVRVTGAMPSSMKLKLIEEVRLGKRHMREF